MMICEAIRWADSENAVDALLTAYLKTMSSQAAHELPADVTALPVGDLRDIRSRLEKLVAEFERRSRLPEAFAFDTVAEATRVFNTALNRLSRVLDERRERKLCSDAERFTGHYAA